MQDNYDDKQYQEVDGDDELNEDTSSLPPFRRFTLELGGEDALPSFNNSFYQSNALLCSFTHEGNQYRMVPEEDVIRVAEHYKDACVADLKQQIIDLKKEIENLK